MCLVERLSQTQVGVLYNKQYMDHITLLKSEKLQILKPLAPGVLEKGLQICIPLFSRWGISLSWEGSLCDRHLGKSLPLE